MSLKSVLKSEEKSYKKFIFIRLGQFVSILGSGLSAFGISIRILAKTKSATDFSLTFLMQILPGIVLAPIAGSFADRKNRKKIMIFADSLDALLKVALIILLTTGLLKLRMIYVFLFISGITGVFQAPAFSASLPEIVPKDFLGRANGMMQLIMAIQNIVAPILAGALYAGIGLRGLFIVDLLTYLFGVLTLLPVNIPQPEYKDEKIELASFMEDLKFSLTYLRKKTGFMEMIMVFAFINFIANLSMVLVGPLVMEAYDEKIYGLVNSASGIGMVVGGALSGLVEIKEGRVKKIFQSFLLSALGLVIMGVSPSWKVIGLGFFVFMLPVPFANGNFGTLTQLKIEGEYLGRVGSLINAILKIVTPLAIILSGILADKVFNPMFVEGGSLYDSRIADLIGRGRGRGIGLLFIISGLLLLITCLSMFSNKKVMGMEENNPDVI